MGRPNTNKSTAKSYFISLLIVGGLRGSVPDWEHDPRLIPFPHGPRQPERHSLRGQSINPGEFAPAMAVQLCSSGGVSRSLPRNPPGASRSTSLGFQPSNRETPPDCGGQIEPAGSPSDAPGRGIGRLDLAMSGPHFKSPRGQKDLEVDCGVRRSHSRQPCPLPAEWWCGGWASRIGWGRIGPHSACPSHDSLITHMTSTARFCGFS